MSTFKRMLSNSCVVILLFTLLLAYGSASGEMALAASSGTGVKHPIHRNNTRRSAGQAPQVSNGKQIVVNLSQQWLYAYENGQMVYNTPVLTGRSALATPTGTYHVMAKLSPTTFRSPWPKGSPYYYEPTYINYALQWKPGGYYLHDSYWHTVYGPGTNGPHYDPQYGWQDGSHGCISMPLDAAQWLYNWAPIGTPVKITR